MRITLNNIVAIIATSTLALMPSSVHCYVPIPLPSPPSTRQSLFIRQSRQSTLSYYVRRLHGDATTEMRMSAVFKSTQEATAEAERVCELMGNESDSCKVAWANVEELKQAVSETHHHHHHTTTHGTKKKQISSDSSISTHSNSNNVEGADTEGGGGGRSSRDKIANEISLGVTLDGGPVVDFASIKDTTSRAERALADARAKYESTSNTPGAVSAVGAVTKKPTSLMGKLFSKQKQNDDKSNSRPMSILEDVSSSIIDIRGSSSSSLEGGGRLMGINDEVVAEVGYEIGTFVDEYIDVTIGEVANVLVQKCASYIRSKAQGGTFPEYDKKYINAAIIVNNVEQQFTKDEILRFDQLLARAYEESGIVTAAFAKTFYLGTQVLPAPAMKAIWAIYVWCRRTDEIVDAPRPEAKDPNTEMLTDLSVWEIRLENLFNRGDVVDVLDLPLLDCKVKFPKLPITPFSDMIRGMLMDIPELGQERYETWDELHLYCYRVAGTVGLMSMPVFGCATGYTDEMAKEPALSLGVAFQITNILRDVGEDAAKRGRVYLPQRDMTNFGVTEQQIFDQIVDDNYINLMKYEIARARMYYSRALRGVPMLRPESRLPVQLSCDAYGKILDKIEENYYDSLTKRAYVGKWEKLAGIPASWYRTQDIAKVFPLPEDWGKPSLDEYEKQLELILKKSWEEQSR